MQRYVRIFKAQIVGSENPLGVGHKEIRVLGDIYSAHFLKYESFLYIIIEDN